MTGDPLPLSMVYRPDDFQPEFVTAAAAVFASYEELAAAAGFAFRAIPAAELLPEAGSRPRLWWRGEDLLERRQCFQVDDFSWDPQTAQHLDAIRRTVEVSTSVLLNGPADGPSHLAKDKLAITHRAAALDLPAVPALAVPFGRYARSVLPLVRERFGDGPFIVKPREMGMGFGVVKADTVEQLAATIDLTGQAGISYLVQPFVPNHGDVRVYVVRGEVITAQHRVPADGGYLANLSQGGTSGPAADSAAITGWSKAIAADLGTGCLAVDWLLTGDGPVLNEWSSGFGGFAGLNPAERTKLADALFAWIRATLDG